MNTISAIWVRIFFSLITINNLQFLQCRIAAQSIKLYLSHYPPLRNSCSDRNQGHYIYTDRF